MTTFRLPACPATGSPSVTYRATVEGPGTIAFQRRAGRGRWCDVTEIELWRLIAAPTDLANWIRAQYDGSRPRHRPRKDPTAARVGKSFRLHPATIAQIVAESQEYGESQGEVIDRWASGRRET